jgi:hypothetical protein
MSSAVETVASCFFNNWNYSGLWFGNLLGILFVELLEKSQKTLSRQRVC